MIAFKRHSQNILCNRNFQLARARARARAHEIGQLANYAGHACRELSFGWLFLRFAGRFQKEVAERNGGRYRGIRWKLRLEAARAAEKSVERFRFARLSRDFTRHSFLSARNEAFTSILVYLLSIIHHARADKSHRRSVSNLYCSSNEKFRF